MGTNRKTNLVEHKELRRKLRHKSTPEEIALWGMLKGRQMCGCQFRRQFSVGAYILDFYCPAVKLCVEVDGIQHQAEENLRHDSKRDAYLSSLGIEVLRIENNAIWNCSDVVVATIENSIKQRLK